MALWPEPPKDGYTIPKDVRVAWAMPQYGPIYPSVYQNHLTVWGYTSRYLALHHLGHTPIVGATDKMYLHSASNRIVTDFLESDCTHLFWTESDMHMPFYAVIALLSHNKDICTGVYFLRKGGGQPCLYMKADKSVYTGIHGLIPVAIFPETSLFQVHCAGMGCALIHRSVFEAIKPPWFDLKEGYNEEGKIVGYGQDVFFYSRVADAKKEVWVDSSIHCGQVYDSYIDINDYHKRITDPEYRPKGFLLTESLNNGALPKGMPVPDDLALTDRYPDTYRVFTEVVR